MSYRIETIDTNFKMTAFGVTFDDFNDWAGNAAKTAARKAEITENGSLSNLTAAALDHQEYQINYVINGKAWRGFGVKGEFVTDDTEILQFLSGDYIVVSGSSTIDQLTNEFFGGIINEITDYKYVGPGNFAFVKSDGTTELWLRAEKI